MVLEVLENCNGKRYGVSSFTAHVATLMHTEGMAIEQGSAMGLAAPAAGAWSRADEALLRTVNTWRQLQGGAALHSVASALALPPRFSPTEVMLASGRYRLLSWHHRPAVSRRRPLFFGWGAAGLRAAAWLQLGAAVGRGSSTPSPASWRATDDGFATVSDQGFYLTSARHARTDAWEWLAIANMTLIGSSAVRMTSTTDRGGITWMVECEWAALLWLLWSATQAGASLPNVQAFVPDGWLQRAAALGHVV